MAQGATDLACNPQVLLLAFCKYCGRMLCMNPNSEPKLAPPGAGLPKLELLVGRLLFAWRRRTGNRELFNTRFHQERTTIRSLAGSCDLESGGRRVLISRLRGLEDSSRYWSVWMALDHLRIVHDQITRVIRALSAGVKMEGKANTANVKPSPQATVVMVSEFERSCDRLLAAVAGVSDLNTVLRFAHPWFGPLNAAGWHALAASHLALHRTQIEQILKLQRLQQEQSQAATVA
jgi:hypothetical protein